MQILVQETVNHLIVFNEIIHAIGWAEHSAWHSWVSILPEYIFLAIALNKQLLLLLILCSCEPTLLDNVDAIVLLMQLCCCLYEQNWGAQIH